MSEDTKMILDELKTLKRDVKEIQLTLENEKEMLLLRGTSLENEVRRLKTRIEDIA